MLQGRLPQQGLQDVLVQGLRVQAELVGQLVGLVLGDRQQVQGHQVPLVVVQDQAEGDPPILPGKEFRPDLGVAAEHRVDLGQVPVALFPHGKGQAALADLPVAAALVGDGVEIPSTARWPVLTSSATDSAKSKYSTPSSQKVRSAKVVKSTGPATRAIR